MSISKKHKCSNEFVDMFVELSQPYFDAGTPITGNCYIIVHKPFPADKLKLKVNGKEKVYWIDVETKTKEIRNPDGTVRFEIEYVYHDRKAKVKFFEVEVKLFDVNGTFMPGQYAFPFIIPTNDKFPGSFCIETNKSDKICLLKTALVEYGIGAKLESTDHHIKDLKYKGEFIVRQRLEPLLMKDHPTNLSYEVTKCFCCGKGNGQISAYIDKNNYALNEVVNVLLMADNTQSTAGINGLSARLTQRITLRTKDHQASFCHDVGSQFSPVVMPPGTKMTAPVQMQVKAVTNPYKYACKNYGADVMNHATIKGKLIECSYTVNVAPTYEGCCVSGGGISFPINLYSPAIAPPKFIMPTNWNPTMQPQISIAVPMFQEQIIMI